MTLVNAHGKAVMSEAKAVSMLKKHMEGWAAMTIGEEYPGHVFQIDFDVADQSFRVDHFLMQKPGACMYVHPAEPDIKAALIRVAGEILERLNIPRRRLEDWEQYIEAAPRAAEAFKCR